LRLPSVLEPEWEEAVPRPAQGGLAPLALASGGGLPGRLVPLRAMTCAGESCRRGTASAPPRRCRQREEWWGPAV